MMFDTVAFEYGKTKKGLPIQNDKTSYLMGYNQGRMSLGLKNITGNPLQFNSPNTQALKSCIVTMEPIQPGSGDPSPENVRPISGWTGCNVYQTGKNLFDKTADDTTNGYVANKYLFSDGAGTTPGTPSDWAISEYISVCPNTVYTISGLLTSGSYNPSICQYDNSKSFVAGKKYENSADVTITTTATTAFIRISIPTANINVLQLELGSTATAYEPYSGTTIPITFPSPSGTVYGGTIDVVSGKLMVDKAYLYVDGSVSINNVSYSTASQIYYATIKTSIGSITSEIDNAHVISNTFIGNKAIRVGHTYVANNGIALVAILPQDITTKEAANAWFSDNPTQFVYDLATHLTYQLTPQEITTIIGRNTMWTDGDNLSIEARVKLVGG